MERDFAAAGDAPLGTSELLDLVAAWAAPSREHREAIACYLSTSEGWDEALKALRGAFASDAAAVVRSSGEKPNEREINQRASEYLQRHAIKPAGHDND